MPPQGIENPESIPLLDNNSRSQQQSPILTELSCAGIEPTALTIALANANAKLDLAGQKIKMGPYTIDHHGVHAPDEIAIPGISFKKYMIYIMIGFFLAAASGASGYAGASAAGCHVDAE
jgi:hypothetical protein